MAYAGPVFSSGNPTVDQLFGRQFAVNQSETAQQMEGEKNAIARQQIMAQEKLAQAQLAGQQQEREQSNLFKMNQQRQVDEQLATDKKYKEGLITRPGTAVRTAAEIDALNAESESAASQLNAAYQTKLALKRAAAQKAYDDGMADPSNRGWWDNRGNHKTNKLTTTRDAAIAGLEDTTLNEVSEIQTKYYPNALIGVDVGSRKFIPKILPGGTVGPSVPFNMGTTPPPGAGGGAPPPPGAGLGAPPVVPDPNAVAAQVVASPTASSIPNLWNVATDPLGTGVRGMMAQTGMDQKLENSLMGNILKAATTFGAPSPGAAASAAVPPAPPVRIPVLNGFLEMSNDVAEDLSRQVSAIAPEQRAAAKKAILEDLLKSGRARSIQPFQPPISSTLGY